MNEVMIFWASQTAFSTKKDFGKEAREAAWAAEQRTLHGLQPTTLFEKSNFGDLNLMAEEAKRRAEITRLAVRRSEFVCVFFFRYKNEYFPIVQAERDPYTQGEGGVFCKAKRIRH